MTDRKYLTQKILFTDELERTFKQASEFQLAAEQLALASSDVDQQTGFYTSTGIMAALAAERCLKGLIARCSGISYALTHDLLLLFCQLPTWLQDYLSQEFRIYDPYRSALIKELCTVRDAFVHYRYTQDHRSLVIHEDKLLRLGRFMLKMLNASGNYRFKRDYPRTDGRSVLVYSYREAVHASHPVTMQAGLTLPMMSEYVSHTDSSFRGIYEGFVDEIKTHNKANASVVGAKLIDIKIKLDLNDDGLREREDQLKLFELISLKTELMTCWQKANGNAVIVFKSGRCLICNRRPDQYIKMANDASAYLNNLIDGKHEFDIASIERGDGGLRREFDALVDFL